MTTRKNVANKSTRQKQKRRGLPIMISFRRFSNPKGYHTICETGALGQPWQASEGSHKAAPSSTQEGS